MNSVNRAVVLPFLLHTFDDGQIMNSVSPKTLSPLTLDGTSTLSRVGSRTLGVALSTLYVPTGTLACSGVPVEAFPTDLSANRNEPLTSRTVDAFLPSDAV